MAGLAGRRSSSADRRQDAVQRLGELRTAERRSRRAARAAPRRRRRERADRRAPQLDAVGVAEVGDQRAHVGPRRAGDRERRAVAVAPAAPRSGRRDLALGDLDRLPRARQRVRAPPADLDRAVGRRALADQPGGQHERPRRHARRSRSARPRGRRWSRSTPAARPSHRPWVAPSGSAGSAWHDRSGRSAARSQTDPACRRGRPSSCAAACAAPGRRRHATSARPACRRQDPPSHAPAARRSEPSGRASPRAERCGRDVGELRGDLLAQEGDQLVVAQLGREPGGLAVAAAAAGARDRRDVDLAVGRAQRDLLEDAAPDRRRRSRAPAPRPSCAPPSAGGR